MKNFIFALLIIFLTSPVQGAVITGGVEYSVTDAQNIILQDNPKPLNTIFVQDNLYDNNRNQNIQNMLKGFTDLKDRTLAHFSDGSYGVIYKNNPLTVLYYSNDGVLTHTEERTSLNYPYKSYKYNTQGKLVNMSLRTSENETFIFNKSGNLIAHWKGKNCYDQNGNIIMTREILK